MDAPGAALGLSDTLKHIQEFEQTAKEVSELLRIVAQWEIHGGEEDKVRRLLADAVEKSKSLSALQDQILKQLSHLKD
jgi:hypothetical protein